MNATSENQTAPTGSLHARDIMTAKVVSVGPDVLIRDVASVLLDNGISAVPVVSGDGIPIGMVSEGDLIGRDEQQRLARRDWWLALIAGRQPLDEGFRTRVSATDRTARDMMSAPLVTVAEDTDVGQIARLLARHNVKRVPVVKDDRIVGIVSRADLLRVVAAGQHSAATESKEAPRNFLRSLFGDYHLPASETVAGIAGAGGEPKPKEAPLTADSFSRLVEDFQNGQAQHRDEARLAAADARRQRAKELIDTHVSDPTWRTMLHGAREAAEHGQTEYLLLRFPNQLCSDGGRAINVEEKDWPSTLRGEAAEVYLRWERELKHRGFTLSARVLEFPGGKPGDIGLSLAWGEHIGSTASDA